MISTDSIFSSESCRVSYPSWPCSASVPPNNLSCRLVLLEIFVPSIHIPVPRELAWSLEYEERMRRYCGESRLTSGVRPPGSSCMRSARENGCTCSIAVRFKVDEVERALFSEAVTNASGKWITCSVSFLKRVSRGTCG